MKQFNIKKFTGIYRIERAVKGNPGVYKIWVWDEPTSQYLPPKNGNVFLAHRKRTHQNSSINEKKTFQSLDQARAWRNAAYIEPESKLVLRATPKFSDVIAEYKKIYLPRLKQSTQESYNRQLGIYFEPFLSLTMTEINPVTIDNWISWLKNLNLTSRRFSFRHEYDLLSGIFKFYAEYDDDYESPLKPRHRRNINFKDNTNAVNKFITEQEFLKFRDCLLLGDCGKIFAAMATVQFYQSLRISEVNGIHWEDLQIVSANLANSVLQISKSVFYSRKKGLKPVVLNSFKNSKSNDGIKILPLLKKSYFAFDSLSNDSLKKGLVFKNNDGELFTYRQIQHAYDSAFKMAELPYSATHIMRHGGASYVYNKTNGDLSMVQSMTGNKDYKSALVYAHRNPLAIREFAKNDWEEKDNAE